jgi:hypothetical protein
MTNEQLNMLRSIIQGEIKAAFMAENCKFDYEQERLHLKAWETLAQSFGHIDAPSNWHQ